MLNNAVTSVQM